ncbi:hypothetical protein A3A71_02220 [Candidatus Berkelbacteria bacterium RIFCSPLOWO2_01_FULL_50_28]|uniref:Uncharacterized protein n=1 Tax=Candidatus Berkelbacteria bacterium RIFCSPLOWO2_01_FULL_50_28 TaxID=1797471 RepID=A0A1F5EBP5_9BACT|nr:MAG: hypothetical protein A2807_00615 [Candidatus Berkelbacteria bacterium RIFCSPHIGHO2_01_FULL_50_36]OGD62197.1 MAG: hypothetical protein A3F39_00635 [Candidatus Berkelbacteria bacterium RIFCSPHIGHO2_12_FULL_50_11]OGD64839.1 MAG: hypothetical protein A3A71_02220 [Candidatus Berkelbacteria bacterium RIFCSPLOWO2_01_FULL_50_28]
MKWKNPPVIKIYEALGAVADERLEINGDNAKVRSSSGGKFYDVVYEPETNSITSNDNGSYWRGYLGYPMIAFLMATKKLPYNERVAVSLKGVAWKDINTKFKNDFAKTEEFIRSEIAKRGGKLDELDGYLSLTMAKINELELNKLKSTAKPPQGY